MERIKKLAPGTSRALSITSKAGGIVSPLLGGWIREVDHAAMNEILNEEVLPAAKKRAPYDLCFLEVTREELDGFANFHRQMRGLLRRGGKFLVFCRLQVQNQEREPLVPRDFQLISGALPECDVAELQFRGGPWLPRLQSVWQARTHKMRKGNIVDLCSFVLTAFLIGPLAGFANWRSTRRPEGELPADCTSLLLEVTVL